MEPPGQRNGRSRWNDAAPAYCESAPKREAHGQFTRRAVWLRIFDGVEELWQALLDFRETYNATWLIERHGFRPPVAVRRDQLSTAAIAA